MVEYVARRDPNRCPTHPGAILRETVLPAVGKSKTEIAKLLDISRQHLHDILKENKPVSAEIAVKLAKMFGGGEIWLRMQTAYDYWHAQRSVNVKNIPTLKAA